MSKRAAAVLFACFCTVLAAYSIRYSYGTLLPEMLTSLSITKAQAGIIYSSYFIAYTVLSPILGLLADRYDMRLVLSGFVVLMGVGTFLMQYSATVSQAVFFFTLAGIGCGACWAPVMALAQRWVGDKRRGMSLAFIDAGSSLGVISAGAMVPIAVSASGWQTGWMGLGIMAMAVGILNFFLIRNSPSPGSSRQTRQQDSSALSEIKENQDFRTTNNMRFSGTYGKILRDRRFWLIGLAYLLTGFTIIIPFTFLSTYAVDELSFSYSSAALLITIIGIGGTLGKITLGPVSDKLGRVKIMVLCAVLISGGCLAMAYSRGWPLMVFCFVYGIGYGACWSMYAACASDFFSKKAAGGIIGLWTLLMGLGSIAAPIVAGWSADSSGTLMWAFIIATAGGFGSLILLLPLLGRKEERVPVEG
ncbi:MAG TPA: MFS transporter [Dehalococcoidales bacterium]